MEQPPFLIYFAEKIGKPLDAFTKNDWKNAAMTAARFLEELPLAECKTNALTTGPENSTGLSSLKARVDYYKGMYEAIQPLARDGFYGKKAKTRTAKAAANARHSKPGGSRDKQKQIREIWATGKYSSRDRCAEEECAALGMSFKAARNALLNIPKPKTPPRC